jgi:hypothetical protein
MKKELAVRKGSTLRALKQSFQGAVPESDGRVDLPHLDFIVGLVFCFLGDTKSFGLEAIRRFMIATFAIALSKGAFWERLSRDRLQGILYDVAGQLMSRLSSRVRIGEDLVRQLGVSAIYLVDSSSLTLGDGARESFPGTRTRAAIKWHACFELLSGHLPWCAITAASRHDRTCFPDIQSLAGKWIIFDLGYWDDGLLMLIDAAKGFFLSRVKRHAAIRIPQVIHGLSNAWVGDKLSALTFKRNRKTIIEVLGEVVHQGHAKLYRVIGFCNPVEKKYPWYITNLSVSAYLLYPLYRIRWHLELICKASKRSFNLDKRLTSHNGNLLESLVLSSIIASFASCVVLEIGAQQLTKHEQWAISVQRIAPIVVLAASDFIHYITTSSKKAASSLVNKISLLSKEMFEKNHRHRPTSLGQLNKQLTG